MEIDRFESSEVGVRVGVEVRVRVRVRILKLRSIIPLAAFTRQKTASDVVMIARQRMIQETLQTAAMVLTIETMQYLQ
jgi:hypothetical protein